MSLSENKVAVSYASALVSPRWMLDDEEDEGCRRCARVSYADVLQGSSEIVVEEISTRRKKGRGVWVVSSRSWQQINQIKSGFTFRRQVKSSQSSLVSQNEDPKDKGWTGVRRGWMLLIRYAQKSTFRRQVCTAQHSTSTAQHYRYVLAL